MNQKRLKKNKKFLQRFQGKSNAITKRGLIDTIERLSFMYKAKLDPINDKILSDNNNPQYLYKKRIAQNIRYQQIKNDRSQKNSYYQAQAKTAEHDYVQVIKKYINQKDDLNILPNINKESKSAKNSSRINCTGRYSQRREKELSQQQFRLPKINKGLSHTNLRKNTTQTKSLLLLRLNNNLMKKQTFIKRITSIDKYADGNLEILNKIQDRLKRQQKPSASKQVLDKFNKFK